MSQAAKDQDQSMEEILQSIKRIIAEEGTPSAAGSDVLELTDMLGDDPSSDEPAMPTMSIDEIMAAPLSSGPTAEPAMPEFTPPPLPEPEPEPVAAAPEPKPVPKPEPKPFVPPPAPSPAVNAAPVIDEQLVSDATLHSAQAALDALKHIPEAPVAPFTFSGVGFRSGTTIEDLMLEALKPMLKEWLDANLTGMVERLVEKEVRKLSARN